MWDKNPVTYPDIQELIDFALDCTRLILGALTGVSRAVSYGNIDDMEGTLMLAKLGLKYQDYEIDYRMRCDYQCLSRQIAGFFVRAGR